jgi:tetratricopeptide (TPR) repeat protein
VPAQLPAGPAGFTGRAGELAELDAILSQGAADGAATVVISAIAGTAGVGKTALALYFGHQVAARFPDGQLYVNLQGFSPTGQVRAPAEVIPAFLEALGVPAHKVPASLDGQVALYRSRMNGRRMLVLLDNARDADQVRPLLPGTPACLVLVTSRNRLAGLTVTDGARPLLLDLLTEAEAQDLLAGRLGGSRVAAEPDAVAGIIASCARLPLALSIVAARAAVHPTFPLAAFAEELRDARGRLDALADDDPAADLRAVFSWSYQAVSDPAARLFRLLGLHPGPDLAALAAASLAAVPTGEVRRLLGELARANLIVEHSPGRYTFHDLLRAYAADLTHQEDSDEERHAATTRLLDHYVHTAHTGARLLFPTRDPLALAPPRPGVVPEPLVDLPRALAWFTMERPVLLAAVDHAEATGYDSHTWQLTWTLWTFLYRQGHWHDQAATGRAAVAAAERLADPPAEALAHRNLARAYRELGRIEDAYTELKRALDLSAQIGDRVGQAHAHLNLAGLLERQGRPAESLDHARQALGLFRAAGHRVGEAMALNSVGWFHSVLGDHEQALVHCREALALHCKLGDSDGQASALDSIGYAHHHLGHHAEAITYYWRAIAMYRQLGDRHYEADTLVHLGDTHHAAGDLRAARGAWRQAVAILAGIDHPGADAVRAKLHQLDDG